MLEREADTLKSEEVGEGHAGDERIERNSRFGASWASGQLQTVGKGPGGASLHRATGQWQGMF